MLQLLDGDGSQQHAAAGRARPAAHGAELRRGYGLDQGPELVEGDALALTYAHLLEEISHALVCADPLGKHRREDWLWFTFKKQFSHFQVGFCVEAA